MGVLKLPENSTRKVYSHFFPGMGMGAMRSMLMPLLANGASALEMPPGLGWSRFSNRQVLSWFVGLALSNPTIQNRVKLLGLLVTEPGSKRTSPYSCSALAVLIATQEGSWAASSAAFAVGNRLAFGVDRFGRDVVGLAIGRHSL